jgi:hypothetical protein
MLRGASRRTTHHTVVTPCARARLSRRPPTEWHWPGPRAAAARIWCGCSCAIPGSSRSMRALLERNIKCAKLYDRVCQSSSKTALERPSYAGPPGHRPLLVYQVVVLVHASVAWPRTPEGHLRPLQRQTKLRGLSRRPLSHRMEGGSRYAAEAPTRLLSGWTSKLPRW